MLSDLTVESQSWFVHDIALVSKLSVRDPEYTAERVRMTLALLVEYGLVDTWVQPADGLRSNYVKYGLSTRHIADFIVATQCYKTIASTLTLGEPARYPAILLSRPASAALFAAQLSECGRHVTDIAWEDPPENLAEVQVAALALTSMDVAATRKDEVHSLLVGATAQNRSTLEGLVVPVSRIPGHPLGAILLDEALRSLTLVARDPIWSVPDDLYGEGAWRGNNSDILDRIELDPSVDNWNCRPLILAWICSSVKEDRRCRARGRLAVWGSRRLDQMVLLLEHMADVDDPQLVGDLVVAALGAAVGSEIALPALLDLARLVDILFFADDARAWTPSVAVRSAARGIIGRAAVIFPGEIDDLVTRSRPPYKRRGPEWPPVDADEVRNSSQLGGELVRGDLSWYVANRCFDRFSNTATSTHYGGHEEIDSSLRQAIVDGLVEAPAQLRALVEAEREKHELERLAAKERQASLFSELRAFHKATLPDGNADDLSEMELLKWAAENISAERCIQEGSQPEPRWSDEFRTMLAHYATQFGVVSCSPLAVRNGMIAHLVRDWGWSEETFSYVRYDDPVRTVDHAIVCHHGSGASHGARSNICHFREKYVWAAVDWIAGELADRLPVWSSDEQRWVRLTTLAGLGNGIPDPFPYSQEDDQTGDSLDIEVPHELLPELFVEEPDPARRAEQWLVHGKLPDPVSVVRASDRFASDAAILARSHLRSQHQSCIDQLVQVRAFAIRRVDVQYVERDLRFVGGRLYEHNAWLEHGNESAALAWWAPWLDWHGTNCGYTSFDDLGKARAIDLLPLVGSFTTHVPDDVPREQTVWVPSPMLAQVLGVVAMRGGHELRSYLDRTGACVATERDVLPPERWSFDDHYLIVDRATLVQALDARGLVPVWVVRVFREASPVLFMKGSNQFEVRDGLKHRSRDVLWLVVGGSGAWAATLLSDVHESWERGTTTR
jgi:hypothetical protein